MYRYMYIERGRKHLYTISVPIYHAEAKCNCRMCERVRIYRWTVYWIAI